MDKAGYLSDRLRRKAPRDTLPLHLSSTAPMSSAQDTQLLVQDADDIAEWRIVYAREREREGNYMLHQMVAGRLSLRHYIAACLIDS